MDRKISISWQGIKRCTQLAKSGLFCLVLAAVASAPVPSLAQPPDSSSASRQTSSAQIPLASAPQPADQSADAVPDDSTESLLPHFKTSRFWLSGQANFIFQAQPGFHSPYSGPNSLSGHYEKSLSRVLTLYTGVRLNHSTEILVDVEEAGGSALSLGLGLAGNTDLDIVRNPLLSKQPYLGRGMIHKVFALSRDNIENTRSYLSLFDELPRRRLEIRFGKFSMPDFFDINSVGSDTHLQFINWATDNNGAWDYAADTRGYTVGAVADFEDRNWGFRAAEALMPSVANGINLVWRPWQARGENFEYELRRGIIPRKGGVVRLLSYVNHANMGVYRDAVIQFEDSQLNEPVPEIANHPWHITAKYGFGVNLEQNLTPNLTVFARWGWDDGKTESFAYTEIDSTVAEGLGVKGERWHRKQDRAGIAFVSNGIKKDHQNYLADGGLGFLLGDGKLNYGRENILETYYTVHVWRGLYLAPGAQYIVDPGYNRDRGPVFVGTLRAHVEF